MAPQILHNNDKTSFLVLWQIGVGSLVCICCVFFGLKLKWFRAQLRLNEGSNKQISTSPVQGVGFKMKPSADDYQFYKVTSEFAPLTRENKNKSVQQNMVQHKNKNYGPSTTSIKPASDSKTKTQISSQPTQILPKIENFSNVKNINTRDTGEKNIAKSKIKGRETEKHLTIEDETKDSRTEMKPILRNESKNKREHKNSVNFDPEPVEISNPSAQKFSDLIKNPIKSESAEESHNKFTSETKKHAPKQQLQIKNPLATRNLVMPVEDEDDWHMKITNEKPTKMEQKYEENNESYFKNNNSISSNMYSSQAANIFFGGQTSTQPQPKPRKFLEMEEDNVSTGSQTSA